MTFSEFGIKRYVMAFMVASAIMLYGIVSYFKLGVDEYPDVDFPFVIVVVTQTGSDAKTMDDTVTSVLLEKLNGISGIDQISGSSSPGTTVINMQFLLEKDVDIAFNEVQSKVNEALGQLPSSIDTPRILKATFSESAIVTLVLTGNRTLQYLNEYAENTIKKDLQTINGVSEIQNYGEKTRTIRVEVDINKLAQYSLSISDISEALRKAHVQAPGGVIVSENKEVRLNLNLEYTSVEDIKSLILVNSNNSFVRLSDVADVVDGVEDFRNYSSYNSGEAISLGVTKISGFNSFAIEKEVIERLNDVIIPKLQDGMSLEIANNSVDYIRASVDILKKHLVEGTILTALVVFLFLRSFISTVIVAVSIPLSLFGAIIIMNIFGYTFNMITLLGLLLLIGVVVDDAIIVLENIYRKIEGGEKPKQAAINGANQIMFAVLAATLSLVAIFGPMMLMSGIVGRFFRSFAVVVTCGVLISYLVAVYIIPMLCSRYLRAKEDKKEGVISRSLESIFQALERFYTKLLSFCLRIRFITLVLAVLFFMSSFVFFSKVPLEFVAEGDKSEFSVLVQTPTGSNIYYTIDKIKQAEKIVRAHSEIKNTVVTVGSGRTTSINRGKIEVTMVPIADRTISQSDFIKKVQAELLDIPGARIIVSAGGGIGGGDYKMSFNLIGPNLDVLYENALKLQEAYRQDPRLVNVDLGMELLPQLEFSIDRDKASVMGLSASDATNAIGTIVGSSVIGKFTAKQSDSSKRYDIILKAKESQINNIDTLRNIYLKNKDNQIVRLDSLVSYREYLGFATIQKVGSLYSAKFNANPPGAVGEALKAVQEITAKTVPSNYTILTEGSTKEMMKTAISVAFVFLMAVVMLYMVLASQFNSFLQPVILMMTIPLAVVGGMFGLFLTGFSLNMFSMIGLVLLVGLVSKNAILLIDFTNEIRAHGKTVKEALLEACPIRLRPILMTSLTVILTMLPAVLSKGEGSESNASLAIVVVGGMISSTLLTLIVIPVLYSVIEEFIEKRRKKRLFKVRHKLMQARSEQQA